MARMLAARGMEANVKLSSNAVRSRFRWAMQCGLAALVACCAFPSMASFAQGPTPPPEIDPAALRSVQAVELQSTGPDGQTSWIIEPDVPRIPKIAGSAAQLSPHIERRLSRAFDLAQRGATYSADAEFRSVLELCARENDARDGGTRRREALGQGFVALLEADEFGSDQHDWQNSKDVRFKISGHHTPVLTNAPERPVDAMQALQAYYAFAEARLTFACEGSQGASLAYYGLARTLVAPGTQAIHAAGKAALLQRVALNIEPNNTLASNELGVLLAQHGQLDGAEHYFRHCVATHATPEAWKNLAVVYARKGNPMASRSALDASLALASQKERQANVKGQSLARSAPAPTNTGPSDAEQKTGLLAKLKDITPKFSNPFRR